MVQSFADMRGGLPRRTASPRPTPSLKPPRRPDRPDVFSQLGSDLNQLGRFIKNAPRNIVRDVKMGTGFMKPDEGYEARTEQSRIKLEERTGIGRGATSSGSGAELTDAIRAAGIDRKAFGTMSDADKRDAMKYNPRLRDAFSRHNSSRGFDFDGSGSGSGGVGGGDDITSPADMYAENKRRYDEYMANKAEADRKSQEMDQARRFYEMRNMGAGRAPPQMQGIGGFRNPYMPRPMPQNQATSPAFRYAAQNYGRLGGQQRMYDRPMEMMSQRERQGVRDVRDRGGRFYPQPMPQPISLYGPGPQYSQQPQYNQQQGIAQLLQNALANKGGGRTAPQPQMPRYQTMPYQVGQGGLPSIGGKGAGRTMPQDRGMRGFGGDPRFKRMM